MLFDAPVLWSTIEDRFFDKLDARCASVMLRLTIPYIRRNELIKFLSEAKNKRTKQIKIRKNKKPVQSSCSIVHITYIFLYADCNTVIEK